MKMSIQEILTFAFTQCIRDHKFNPSKPLKDDLLAFLKTSPFFLPIKGSDQTNVTTVRSHFREEAKGVDLAMMVDTANHGMTLEEQFIKSAHILVSDYLNEHYEHIIDVVFENFPKFVNNKFESEGGYSVAVSCKLRNILKVRIIHIVNMRNT